MNILEKELFLKEGMKTLSTEEIISLYQNYEIPKDFKYHWCFYTNTFIHWNIEDREYLYLFKRWKEKYIIIYNNDEGKIFIPFFEDLLYICSSNEIIKNFEKAKDIIRKDKIVLDTETLEIAYLYSYYIQKWKK